MPTSPTRHSHLLRAADALLLVVDMQEPFLRAIWERHRVEANVARLIDAAAVLGVPVIATLQYMARMGGVTPDIARRLPAEPAPIDKMAFSCAAEPACMEAIQGAGRSQVLICGVETHICVSQTVHDLLAAGLQVHVASDAVSSRVEANWRLGLERAAGAGAIVTSTEMAIYELLVMAGTPEFSRILPLVK